MIQTKLAQEIEKHKIIMAELVEKTELSRKGIYNALQGKQNTGWQTLNKIGAEVGIELTWRKMKKDEK